MINPGTLTFQLKDEVLPKLQRALENRHANPEAVANLEFEVEQILEQIDQIETLEARNAEAARNTPVIGGGIHGSDYDAHGNFRW